VCGKAGFPASSLHLGARNSNSDRSVSFWRRHLSLFRAGFSPEASRPAARRKPQKRQGPSGYFAAAAKLQVARFAANLQRGSSRSTSFRQPAAARSRTKLSKSSGGKLHRASGSRICRTEEAAAQATAIAWDTAFCRSTAEEKRGCRDAARERSCCINWNPVGALRLSLDSSLDTSRHKKN